MVEASRVRRRAQKEAGMLALREGRLWKEGPQEV